MNQSGVKDPSFYKKISYGFFASLRMTKSKLMLLTGIDRFNHRSNNGKTPMHRRAGNGFAAESRIFSFF